MFGTRSRSNSTSSMGEEGRWQLVLERLNKLDNIESSISNVEGSVNEMNNKMDSFNSRLLVVESDCTDLKNRMEKVEGTNNAVLTLDKQYKEAIRKTNVSRILNDLHNKRLNIIAHNVPKSTGNAWETWEESRDKVTEFIRDTLKVDITKIVIVDSHRLRVKNPRFGKPLPLIFKVATIGQKRLIAKGLTHLKDYNSNKDKQDKIWVDLAHLPEQMQQDRDALKSKFLEARAEKRNHTGGPIVIQGSTVYTLMTKNIGLMGELNVRRCGLMLQ